MSCKLVTKWALRREIIAQVGVFRNLAGGCDVWMHYCHPPQYATMESTDFMSKEIQSNEAVCRTTHTSRTPIGAQGRQETEACLHDVSDMAMRCRSTARRGVFGGVAPRFAA